MALDGYLPLLDTMADVWDIDTEFGLGVGSVIGNRLHYKLRLLLFLIFLIYIYIYILVLICLSLLCFRPCLSA